MTARLLRNLASNGLGFFLTALVGFLFTPFLVHTLGNAVYGLWVLTVSFTGFVGLLDLGTRSTITKFVSQYRATNDLDGLNRFVNTILAIGIALGTLALLISIGAIFFFERLFKIPVEHHHYVPWIVTLLGLNLAVTFPFTVFQGILFGTHRFVTVNAINLATTVLRTLALWALLSAGHGVVTMGWVTLVFTVLMSLVFVWLSYVAIPGLRIRFLALDREEATKIVHYSLSSFGINVADMIIYTGASMIVGIMISTAAVTLYSIAETLVSYMRRAVLSFATVLIPVTSEMQARGELDRLVRLATVSTRATLLLLLPVGALAVVVGDDFTHLWLGPGYELTAKVLAILTLGQVLALSQYGSEALLYGINRHRRLSVLMISISAVIILLSVLFIPLWGLQGVAFACAAPLTIGQTICVPLFLRRFIGLSVPAYLRQGVIPGFPPAVLFGIALVALERWIVPDRWLSFFAIVGLAFLLYLPLVFYLGLTAEERSRALRFVRRLRPVREGT